MHSPLVLKPEQSLKVFRYGLKDYFISILSMIFWYVKVVVESKCYSLVEVLVSDVLFDDNEYLFHVLVVHIEATNILVLIRWSPLWKTAELYIFLEFPRAQTGFIQGFQTSCSEQCPDFHGHIAHTLHKYTVNGQVYFST